MTLTKIRPGMTGADYVYLTEAMKVWLLEHDVRFVARYFVDPASTRINKDFKPEELEWLTKHGIAVVPNYERHHNDSAGGAVAAERNMIDFINQLLRFEVPKESPVIVSADTDVWAGNIDASEEYMRRCCLLLNQAGYLRFGGYMDDDLAYRIADLDPIVWRPNALGWDGEPRPTPVNIQQHRALYPPGVDPNTCIEPFYAWLPGAHDPTWKEGEGMGLHTKTPKQRLFDSRFDGDKQPARAGEIVKVGIPAAPNGEAPHTAIVTVTVVGATESGHLQVDGDSFGKASDGNYQPGDIEASSTIAALSEQGTVNMRISHGTAHLIVDLMGVVT